MKWKQACPFYGGDEEQCDVGAGYISPHDVEIIVRHCISRYEDCGKYLELTARCPETSRVFGPEGYGSESGDICQDLTPRAEPGIVVSMDPDALTAIHHELRTPLTSIRSFTEILLLYPVEDLDAKRQFLRLIHGEAERLARTVDLLFGTPDAAPAGEIEADAAEPLDRKTHL